MTDETFACPHCAEPASAEDRFCRNCGRALHDLAQSAETPSRQVRPSTERRLVTVLFADLVGFTSRSEHEDPEDVAAFLGDYFERSADVIARFGGALEKYIGDAVMAVWGARSANEDDAERAVRAGLELQDAIGKLAAEAGDPDIRLRVGILTGEAAVRPGGNESTGMIVGDLVNSASRLQEIAEPGTVYVGPTTYRAASDAIAFEPAGEHEIKGRQELITAWRAVRVVAERGGHGRVEGLDPPFVGRSAELHLLKDLLSGVMQTKRARLVSIIGEPGIGKSALIWELRKYADGLATDILWNRGRSLSYGSEGIVHRAVSDMLRGRLGVAESDPPETVGAALDTTLDTFFDDPGERARIRPWLASLLGLADAPDGDRSEFDAAIRNFIAHMAAAGPTVVVFDDLHWGGAGLLDLVEQLPDWMPDSPVLIIAITRPELLTRRSGWATARRGVVTLRLAPLTDGHMSQLLEGMMGDLDPRLRADIVDRAAGIPLYAVELTRALIGTDQTISIDGKTASRTDLAEFGIPETLQSLIGSRIDRLEAPLPVTLQDAAVLGHSFTLDALVAVTGTAEAELAGQLERLVDQELIAPIHDPRSPLRGGYQFVQKLVGEVARNRVSREMRRVRHIAAAEYIVASGGADAAAFAADHYLSALAITRDEADADALRTAASGVLLAALDRAAALYAHEEVLSLGSKILDLELELMLDQRADVKERMAAAASALLRPDEAARHAEEALALSRRCGDIAGVRRSAALLALVNLENFRIDTAIELLNEQLSDVADLSEAPELANLAGLLGRARFLRGDFDEAMDIVDRALIAAEEHDLKSVVGDAMVTKATVLGVRGRPIEARLMLESVIELAKRYELNAVALRAYLNLGAVVPVADLGGDPTVEAIELGRRVGNLNFTLLAMGNLVGTLIVKGEWDEVDALLADPLWDSASGSVALARLSLVGIAAALRGGTTEAQDALYSALGAPRDRTDLARTFAIEAFAGLVRLLTGHHEEAMQWAAETLANVDSLPWIDATARVLLLNGEPEQLVELANAVVSRRQTNDDRLGPFLRTLARVVRGEPGAVDDARAAIAPIATDGIILDHVVWMVGLGRSLPAGDPDRLELMGTARELVTRHGMPGLRPFLDPEPSGDD